jgi:hypothetical protein
MDLMPDQFWSLTMHEFGIKYRAFIRAENRLLKLIARHALMVAPHGKNMTPEKLLGVKGMFHLYPLRDVD